MNLNETTKVLAFLAELRPTFAPTSDTCRAWQLIFENERGMDVYEAVRSWVRSNVTSYPPSASDIFAEVGKIKAASAKPEPARIAPSFNQDICLEHYEVNGRQYVRASKGARAAINAHYARMKRERDYR